MKSVYIDVLITVNVFIDFILILCTKKALCINTSFKKMLLASLLGGVQSLIALFTPLPFFLNIPIDVLCAAGIVLCAFGRCPFKCFIKRISVCFGFIGNIVIKNILFCNNDIISRKRFNKVATSINLCREKIALFVNFDFNFANSRTVAPLRQYFRQFENIITDKS